MARSEVGERESERLQQPVWDRTSRQSEPYHPSMWSTQTGMRHSAWEQGDLEVAQAQRLARALGWFSIGLGLTELTAPATVSRLAGLNGKHGLVRVLGLREIAQGVGILSRRKPLGWLWSRVFGDAIDLALLGKAAASPNTNKRRIAAAAAAVTGVTVLDFKASQTLTEVADAIEDEDSLHVAKSILINKPPEEIYRFWRDLKNLPRVMEHLQTVEITDNKRSRWVAKGPAGRTIQWEAEITEDRPNEMIAWRSVEGSTVDHAGSVSFEPAPGGRGTLIRVELSYRPPAGRVGATVAKLLGQEPQLQLEEDLRRLKQIMEAGEVITTEGQPAGRPRSTSWKYDYAARKLAAGL